MILRADIGQQKRLFLRALAPFVVTRRTHVAPVIARSRVVIGGHLGAVGLRVSLKLDAATLERTRCMVGRQVPHHPVGYAVVLVIRYDIALTAQRLRRHAGLQYARKQIIELRFRGRWLLLCGFRFDGRCHSDTRHERPMIA